MKYIQYLTIIAPREPFVYMGWHFHGGTGSLERKELKEGMKGKI
jgi:hypothetical protein